MTIDTVKAQDIVKVQDDGKAQHGGPNIIVGSLNGLQGLEELKDLGRTIRESLPEWLREKVGEDKITLYQRHAAGGTS